MRKAAFFGSLILLLFAFMTAAATAYGAQFTADIFITGQGADYTYKLHVKDNMYRFQKIEGPMNVPPFPAIVNRDTGVTWGLNADTRQYVEITDIQRTILTNPLVGWAATRKDMTEKPGGTETVNGYECETRLYTRPGKQETLAKVWFSRKLNHIIREERFGSNKNPVMELKNIAEGQVDDALFRIPEGYIKFTEPSAGERPAAPKRDPQARQAGGRNSVSAGNIVFILDASGSMWGQVDGKAKITIAREVLTGLIKDLPEDASVGLVAYGHRRKGDCNDVEEIVPLKPVDKKMLITTIQELNPKGKTPITLSVRRTAEKIKHLEDETTIILVSDGKETCEGDPCALVKELKEAGVRFVMHVIGFDVTEEERVQLECMARSGDGEYFTAKTARDFQLAAREVVRKASEKLPVSLEVSAVKDGKPFRAHVAILAEGGEKQVTEGWTSPEKPVVFRLPPAVYDIRARDTGVIEKPVVDIRGVEIVEGRMTKRVANFTTEGVLHVKAVKNSAPAKALVQVSRQEDGKFMGDGWTKEDGTPAEYKLLPGVYKIRVQDQSVKQRPVVWIENVEIKADQTVERFATFVEGGLLKITATRDGAPHKAYVKLYQNQDNKYMGDGWTKEDGTPADYRILPGVYTARVEDRTDRSVREIRDIQVQSGRTLTVNAAFPVEKGPQAEEQKPAPVPTPVPQARPSVEPAPETGGESGSSGSGEQRAGGGTLLGGEVPLFEGAEVRKELTQGPNGKAEMVVPATVEKVIAFYQEAMSAQGWQTGMHMVQGPKGALMMVKAGRQLVISAQQAGNRTEVSIVLITR